jgi:hypothetical protein
MAQTTDLFRSGIAPGAPAGSLAENGHRMRPLVLDLTIPFAWFCTGIIEKDPTEQCQQQRPFDRPNRVRCSKSSSPPSPDLSKAMTRLRRP